MNPLKTRVSFFPFFKIQNPDRELLLLDNNVHLKSDAYG